MLDTYDVEELIMDIQHGMEVMDGIGRKMTIPTEDDINEDALDEDFQRLELECKVEGQRPKSKQESCEEELDVSYTCSHRRLSKCLYVSMFAYYRV
jgi:hypothetical protein